MKSFDNFHHLKAYSTSTPKNCDKFATLLFCSQIQSELSRIFNFVCQFSQTLTFQMYWCTFLKSIAIGLYLFHFFCFFFLSFVPQLRVCFNSEPYIAVYTLLSISFELWIVFSLLLICHQFYNAFQTKPLTVITALFIWVLAIVCATPAAIMSKAVTVILNNTTNQTIITCTPFGPEGPMSKTYAQ